MAVGPSSHLNVIKKIDFVPLTNRDAVVLIVTDQGHVQHQNIQIPDDMNIEDLKEVIKTLDELLRNRKISEASSILEAEFAKK